VTTKLQLINIIIIIIIILFKIIQATKPNKCTKCFFKYSFCNITLNIAACFDPQR